MNYKTFNKEIVKDKVNATKTIICILGKDPKNYDELVKETGFHKVTVEKVLFVLEELGYVIHKYFDSKKYFGRTKLKINL